jgi:hypothetical protein
LPHLKVDKEVETSHGVEYICWCAFHPDGQGKPPHQPNLHVSERGFYCHACKAHGGLIDLARRLGLASDGTWPEATYDYTDEEGNLLYQVVRFPGKTFRCRRPDADGGWIWDLKGVRRVLYRLHQIVANPEAVVYVVEGEKDADLLAKNALIATTNLGGAAKWRDEDSQALTGHGVVIIPDNDDVGRSHAHHAARSLMGVAKSVKLLELPDLPEKGDVSNWLNSGHTAEELLRLAEEAPTYQPVQGTDTEASHFKHQGRPPTPATRLAKLALDGGLYLFHDQNLQPFARLPNPDGPRIVPLDSFHFRHWLAHLAYHSLPSTAGSQALDDCLQYLEGTALYGSPQHYLHVRYALHEGAIWIDLDGQRAIRVLPGRWEIVLPPPIIFAWFPDQRSLPDPISGGDPERIFQFVNVRGAQARTLLRCWLPAAMVPGIPIPILALHGPQGSAKTTSLKAVKRLLDPSEVEVRGPIHDQEELALEASQSRVLMLDNLSSVRKWLSDALSRTVTGEGWTKRRHYTNTDRVTFRYQTVVGLSGINLVANQPDLLDRCLIIQLEAIRPEERREEVPFWKEFEEQAGYILGGFLDVLAKAMAIHQTLHLEALPRMADFARWGAAAAEAQGIGADAFLGAYQGNVERQNQAAIDESAEAQALLLLVQDRVEWQGSPTQLVHEIQRSADERGLGSGARNWSRTPNWFTRRLRELQPNLLAMGIEISEHRTGAQRVIRIRKRANRVVTGVIAVTRPADKAQPANPDDDTLTPDDGMSSPNDACNHSPPRSPDGNDGKISPLEGQCGHSPLGHTWNWPPDLSGLPEEAQAEFSERAGKHMADGMSREEAERRALGAMLAKRPSAQAQPLDGAAPFPQTSDRCRGVGSDTTPMPGT